MSYALTTSTSELEAKPTIYLLKSGCHTASAVRPLCIQRPAHSGRSERRARGDRAWRANAGRTPAEARSAESKQGQDDTERSDVSS